MLKKTKTGLILLLVAILGIFGFTSTNSPYVPLNTSEKYYDYLQPTFSQYLVTTRAWLTRNRKFISADREQELAYNMPFELSPTQPTKKAVLLVHGLGDSPFSFADVGRTLRDQGIYVQTLLLPGHGSKPSDLTLPRYQDWQTIVDHYASLLKQDFEEIWLGGFSTGGNLVTAHTIQNGGVDGLILFSPGFQSQTPILERLAPIASIFTDGYETAERNVVRYTSAPIKGGIAYSDSARQVRALLDQATVNVPTLIVMSEADSVVDTHAIQRLFKTRFKNARNEFILYGEKNVKDHSFTTLTMRLEDKKISTGSHMSPLFAPSNVHYGEQSEFRICMNSFDHDAVAKCEQGAEVWYSAWGYKEEDKIYARLTWNPYYDLLENSIQKITKNFSVSR